MVQDTQPVAIQSQFKGTSISDGDRITITVDASITEQHTLTNTVTDHPVEEGFNVTDHSRPEPDQLQLECIISNTPLSQKQQTRIVKSGEVQVQTSAQNSRPRGAPGYAESAFEKLRKLRDAGTLVKVVTTLRTYENMAILSIAVPRDPKTFDALRFTITFKFVRVVKNKLTTQVVSADKRVAPAVKKGSETPEQDPVEHSALTKIVDGGKDLLKGLGH